MPICKGALPCSTRGRWMKENTISLTFMQFICTAFTSDLKLSILIFKITVAEQNKVIRRDK